MLFNVAVLIALIPTVLAGPIPTAPKAGDVIPGQYIIVLKEDLNSDEFSAHQDYVVNRYAEALSKRGETPSRETVFAHTYNFGKLKGYAGVFDDATIEEIAARPEVAYVEADKIFTTQDLVTQSNVPSWGLARISHRSGGSTTYVYDSSAGSGTFAYVLDTGVFASHSQFGGRATAGYNAIGHGHGTHVAGTIAGSTVGIAKAARVIGVKVLGSSGSGSTSGIIAGIQWVLSDAQSKNRIGKAVANMSLGGTFSSSLNSAITSAINGGIPFAVAAGNDNANAANYSPASAPAAITVGATTSTDTRASYSNYGSVLDVFAPGSSITSAWIGSTSATNTISGTSMASPHVCGLAAYLMAFEGLTTPSAVVNRIVSLSITGVVTTPGTGSPNRLIYNGSGL
ncbi:putative endopeptidase K [Kalaharituber pfeilii]|nr:putative endopeptidase K [Kalaharituber pfeilii]